MRNGERILVTGATGFVGQALVRVLRDRGYPVRAFGRNRPVLERLASLGAEPLFGDLCDRASVDNACKDVDMVFHVGAFSAPWGPAARFHAVNVEGTAHIVASCRTHHVRRLVHVSSPSVTFDGHDCIDQDEAAPFASRFVSDYSRTKKAAEEIVRAARDEREVVIVRPKAIFGPGDTSLLPRLIQAARAGRLPQIGTGNNRVAMTYIDNVVHGLLLAGTASKAVGNTYILTNGDLGEAAPCLWSVVRYVLRSLDLPQPRIALPLPAALTTAKAMEAIAAITGKEPRLTRYSTLILARTQTYDIGAARRDLGYSPVVPFSDALERTIAAFRLTGQGTA